jgi:hypothetical protein
MKAELIKQARWENLEPYLIRRGKKLIKPVWPAPALYDEAALAILACGASATQKCFEFAGSPADWPLGDMSYHILVYYSALVRTEIARGMPFEFASPAETWTKLRTAIPAVKTGDDTLIRFRAASESRFRSEEDPAFKDGFACPRLPIELSLLSPILSIPLPKPDFMERFAFRLLVNMLSCEKSEVHVIHYWKEIRDNADTLRSTCKAVFKEARQEQKKNFLWIVCLIVAGWVCFGHSKELALKMDGSPNGIVASIRQSVQRD